MSNLTIQFLWNALTSAEKDDACLAFWETKDDFIAKQAHDPVLQRLASRLRFRLVFLQRKKPKERAIFLRRFIDKPDFHKFHNDILRAWLLTKKNDLIVSFLDVQGIKHTNGLIHDDVPPPTEDSLRAGIKTILERFPSKDIAIYLGYLFLFGGDYWAALPDVIKAEGLDFMRMLIENPEEKKMEEMEEEPTFPESSPAFTTLDEVLIRTVVAAALGEDNALSVERAEALIDEIIAMDTDRQRSWFHKGFFHALFDKPMTFTVIGENEERRLWYFSGVLSGMLRRMESDKCMALLKEHSALTKGLSQNGKLQCGAILLMKPFYDLLIEAKEYVLLSQWLQTHLKNIDPNKRVEMLIQTHYDAASLLRSGSPLEALPLLDVIDNALREDRNKDFPDGFAEWLTPFNQRKRAQAFQLLGDFTSAETILLPLTKTKGFEDAANALTDLALIKGGFRSLEAILPVSDEKKNIGIKDSLVKGETLFKQAVNEFGSEATNAHFCLGILNFLRGSNYSVECADHFKQALVGMMKRQNAYEEVNLIQWARFLLAVSLLETAEPTAFRNAAERIGQSIKAKVTFPVALWERALRAAIVFDDTSLAEQIAEYLLQCRGNEAYRLIQECSVALHCKGIRNRYLDWLLSERLPLQVRWDELRKLLPIALNDLSLDQAEQILDAMERLAWEHEKYRILFADLLRDDRNYSPAWEVTEAEIALSRLYELGGDLYQASEVLKGLIHKLKTNGSEYNLQQARSILEHIQSFKLDDESLDHLSRLVEESAETKEAVANAIDLLKQGQEVAVLYIGGNETQEAYADKIREDLSEIYPGLKISFYFPKWDSNWNVHLDKIRPMIGANNAVVLSNLIRTGLGQHIRKLCNDKCPWFACTGRGKQSLKSSIEKAAIWAVQNK